MQIETVTVGLTLTQSLPDYNNVKPSLSLTARLEPGESVAAVVTDLHARVTAYCHDEVDAALEAADRPPRYFTGPLFRLFLWQQRNALVILPADVQALQAGVLPGDWRPLSPPARLETVEQRALLQHQGCQEVIEATSPDALDDLRLWWNAQTWYVAYGLVTWRDHWNWDVARALFIRHGLSIPRQSLQTLDDAPRTLAVYTRRFSDLDGWSVADDQATLDRLVADWLAEHPRPPAEVCSAPEA